MTNWRYATSTIFSLISLHFICSFKCFLWLDSIGNFILNILRMMGDTSMERNIFLWNSIECCLLPPLLPLKRKRGGDLGLYELDVCHCEDDLPSGNDKDGNMWKFGFYLCKKNELQGSLGPGLIQVDCINLTFEIGLKTLKQNFFGGWLGGWGSSYDGPWMITWRLGFDLYFIHENFWSASAKSCNFSWSTYDAR